MALIKTNNQPRDILSIWEFTEAEQQQIRQDFEWLEDDEFNFGFFKYRDQIGHISMFSSTRNCPTAFEGWDGFMSNTYYSGFLIRFTPDRDQVIVARYSS